MRSKGCSRDFGSVQRTDHCLVFAVLLALLCVAARPVMAQRARYNFNSNWLLQTGDLPDAQRVDMDDHGWKRVTLPHAWNEDYAFRVSIYEHPTGIAWYRKHFTAPSGRNGDRVYVEFEGVRQAAEVYLNGHFLGRNENGVAGFGFDLTPFLLPADNVLAVRTDNQWDYREKATGGTLQWNDRNFNANFGGITKNVWLHVTPAIHQTLPLYSSLGTTGQYIWANDFDISARTATIHTESQVHNESGAAQWIRLRAQIHDRYGNVIASAISDPVLLAPNDMKVLSAVTPAKDLHFWSWGYGYLYDVITTLIVDGKETDAVSTRTGFRETAFHNGMIYLNGRVLQVHGYSARSTNEWPGLGTDVPPWVSDFSNGLMVADNADLVRWMHITPAKQDVESCDRVGLLESMPAGDAERDAKDRQWEARVELMRDSIIYNRNNPSIIFYESGNKGISEEHMQDMLSVWRQFDPHGGRAIGAREMLASHTAMYGGEMLYIDKSSYKPVWAHEYNRDEGARKFWDEQSPPYHKDSPLYNRNQDSFTLTDVLRWDDYYRARPGTGNRVSSGGVNISWIDENSHFRGDNNYRRSGEVDSMRIPKDAFYAHQVMWDGWVDPEHPRVHIVGHWNYPDGTKRTVYVVGNSAEVELNLNGHSLGVQHPTHDFLFTFPDITYQPGILQAIAYDNQHRRIAETQIETAGKPALIRLTPHVSPTGLHADGSDLALVDVEVVDAQGRRVPTALNLIQFTLDGPAEWRGGIAQGSAVPVSINTTAPNRPGMTKTPPAPYLHQDNYVLSKSLPVEGGMNRVSIRSTSTPGIIHLTAKSEGLEAATITLTSQAVQQQDGTSEFDPSSGLPGDLSRGPTPITPSYRVTRQPILFVAAAAGANSGDAFKSFDDDETTAWTNASAVRTDTDTDGLAIKHAAPDSRSVTASLDQAWIEYTFEAPEKPTEMDMKLGSFRIRRYPLRITLDGNVVYEGLTPTSLGYVTLPLHVVTPGTKLRIQLTSPPSDVKDEHPLVEMNGTIDQSEATGKEAEPVLSIVEAEAYSDTKQ